MQEDPNLYSRMLYCLSYYAPPLFTKPDTSPFRLLWFTKTGTTISGLSMFTKTGTTTFKLLW